MQKNKIRIIYKKLGREQAYGIAHSDGEVWIEERLKGKPRKLMEILLHECLHILNPKDEEDEIIYKSVALTKILWKEGFRLIIDQDDIPLQDGTK
jgi:hypothetical protein